MLCIAVMYFAFCFSFAYFSAVHYLLTFNENFFLAFQIGNTDNWSDFLLLLFIRGFAIQLVFLLKRMASHWKTIQILVPQLCYCSFSLLCVFVHVNRWAVLWNVHWNEKLVCLIHSTVTVSRLPKNTFVEWNLNAMHKF